MKIEIKIGKDTTKEGKWSEKEETDLRNQEEVKRKLYLYVFELFWNYLSRVTWNNSEGWGNAIKKQWITYLNPKNKLYMFVLRISGYIQVSSEFMKAEMWKWKQYWTNHEMRSQESCETGVWVNWIHWSAGNKGMISKMKMTGIHKIHSSEWKPKTKNWKILQTKKSNIFPFLQTNPLAKNEEE